MLVLKKKQPADRGECTMDDSKAIPTYTETLDTPNLGMVSYGQVTVIAEQVQACLMRMADPVSIGLTLKVVKGDIPHTYPSMAGFERNYSAFDVFKQFDMTLTPRYESDAIGPITRMRVYRTQNLRIDIDASGSDEEKATACTRAFCAWLEDYFSNPAADDDTGLDDLALPEIPVLRAALPVSEADQPTSLEPLPIETERKDKPAKKTFLQNNLVEIIFAILGLIGVYLLITNMLQ
jgi:hypothetical protein